MLRYSEASESLEMGGRDPSRNASRDDGFEDFSKQHYDRAFSGTRGTLARLTASKAPAQVPADSKPERPCLTDISGSLAQGWPVRQRLYGPACPIPATQA